jgi:hypothetical protein
LEQSLEGEKTQNDFLEGVPAIVEAIRSGKIQCRVYLDGNRILTEPGAIAVLIRSEPDTPRRRAMDRVDLSELRKRVERQVVADYLRLLQAPVGVTPILKCWMER